jgi:type IV secretory pathway TrbD component
MIGYDSIDPSAVLWLYIGFGLLVWAVHMICELHDARRRTR